MSLFQVFPLVFAAVLLLCLQKTLGGPTTAMPEACINGLLKVVDCLDSQSNDTGKFGSGQSDIVKRCR